MTIQRRGGRLAALRSPHFQSLITARGACGVWRWNNAEAEGKEEDET